jgi:hypothetical protein
MRYTRELNIGFQYAIEPLDKLHHHGIHAQKDDELQD